MYFLCLLCRGDFASADGPNGFIGDDDLGPVFGLFSDGFELGGYHLDGLVAFSLLQSRQLERGSRMDLCLLTSSVSPQHSMTPKPPSSAAFVLLAMNYIRATSSQHHSFLRFHSSASPVLYLLHPIFSFFQPKRNIGSLTSSFSPRITLRSLCPHNVQPILLSLNCSALISPVKAPLPLSNTFWLQTSISLLRCSRTRSRKRPGGAMTTSVLGSRGAELRWCTISVIDLIVPFLCSSVNWTVRLVGIQLMGKLTF